MVAPAAIEPLGGAGCRSCCAGRWVSGSSSASASAQAPDPAGCGSMASRNLPLLFLLHNPVDGGREVGNEQKPERVRLSAMLPAVSRGDEDAVRGAGAQRPRRLDVAQAIPDPVRVARIDAQRGLRVAEQLHSRLAAIAR